MVRAASFAPQGKIEYDVPMTRRFGVALAILLIPALAPPGRSQAEAQAQAYCGSVMTNLASPYGHELDHRMIEFQTSNPHTSSGRPMRDPASGEWGLQGHVDQAHRPRHHRPDRHLDAPEDADLNPNLQADMGRAVNVCAALRACPANVPALIPPGLKARSWKPLKNSSRRCKKARRRRRQFPVSSQRGRPGGLSSSETLASPAKRKCRTTVRASASRW